MASFTCTHKAQYYETDQMGVVHHSNYIRWFEEARTEFLEHYGYPYRKLEETGIFCPVIEAEAKYRSMVRYGDIVSIETSVAAFNGIRMEVRYEIRDQQTGEIRTTGLTRHCFLNREGRPLSLKKSFPEIYEKFLTLL